MLILAVLAPAGPSLADDGGVFRFRGQEYRATGSNVSRRLVWTSQLPFEGSFSELTPTQMAYIRDQYDGLLPEEDPPYPADGLRAIFRRVDDDVALLIGQPERGPLVAVAKVDETGAVQSVSVYKSPNAAVTAAIGQALLKTEFKPARRNGKPVAMDFVVRAELH
jgi:hypothetical protein